jgi:hypothetical protein
MMKVVYFLEAAAVFFLLATLVRRCTKAAEKGKQCQSRPKSRTPST